MAVCLKWSVKPADADLINNLGLKLKNMNCLVKPQSRDPHCNGDDWDTDSEEADDYILMPLTGQISKDILGRSYLSSLKAMDSISAIFSKSEWLDCCKGAVNACKRLQPDYIPSLSWLNMIKNQCNAMFKRKFTGYSLLDKDQNSDELCTELKLNDLVRLLPVEYFRKDFRAEKMESNILIDNTAGQLSSL